MERPFTDAASCTFDSLAPAAPGRSRVYGGIISNRLQASCPPRMSLGHERGSETEHSQCLEHFAQLSIPPLRHRQSDFRYRLLDASNGARMGDGRAYEQSDLAGNGESRSRV